MENNRLIEIGTTGVTIAKNLYQKDFQLQTKWFDIHLTSCLSAVDWGVALEKIWRCLNARLLWWWFCSGLFWRLCQGWMWNLFLLWHSDQTSYWSPLKKRFDCPDSRLLYCQTSVPRTKLVPISWSKSWSAPSLLALLVHQFITLHCVWLIKSFNYFPCG